MKNKLSLQELLAWQWEINSFQTAALLIEERLIIIFSNNSVHQIKNKVGSLLKQVKDQEKELNEIEKKLIIQKECIQNENKNHQKQSLIDADQESIREYIIKEKSIFNSLKQSYFNFLKELL